MDYWDFAQMQEPGGLQEVYQREIARPRCHSETTEQPVRSAGDIGLAEVDSVVTLEYLHAGTNCSGPKAYRQEKMVSPLLVIAAVAVKHHRSSSEFVIEGVEDPGQIENAL